MGLRFPSGILFLRATSNINRATANLVKAEAPVSSGKNVNTLSDNPAAATRIITLSRELLDGERFGQTINQGKAILETGTGALQSASEVTTRAREIALQAGNPTLSQLDRNALADEVEGLLTQAMGLANSKSGGRYVFAGSKTGTAPYSSQTIAGQEYSVYNGNLDPLDLLIAPGRKLSVTLPGPNVFKQGVRGPIVFSGSTGASVGSHPSNGTNNDTLQVTHNATSYSGSTGIAAGSSSAAGDTVLGASGTHTLTIDHAAQTLSLNGGPAISYADSSGSTDFEVANENGDKVYVDVSGITASGAVDITSTGYLSIDGGATLTAIDFSANQKVVDSATGELLHVNSSAIVRTGDEYVTYKGTFDLFTALRNLRDDLKNTREIPEAEQVESIKSRIEHFESLHETVLSGLSILGERLNQLSQSEEYLFDTQADVKQLLSSIQDTDLALAISNFTRAQIALEYAQSVTAKLLQSNFASFF